MTTQRMHRDMTREQGQALETIGHAFDYLNARYLHSGADDEILDFRGPEMDAVRILIGARRELLASLPLIEALPLRLWHALSRRGARIKSVPVVPLSSSR